MPFEPAVESYLNDMDLLHVDQENLDMAFETNLNKIEGSLRQAYVKGSPGADEKVFERLLIDKMETTEADSLLMEQGEDLLI